MARHPEAPRRRGATLVAIVDEVLDLIDQAAEPLKERQKVEADELQARIERLGERGSGRKELEDRHKRELRRHRTDELRFGLATLTGAYRDRLVAEVRATTLEPSI